MLKYKYINKQKEFPCKGLTSALFHKQERVSSKDKLWNQKCIRHISTGHYRRELNLKIIMLSERVIKQQQKVNGNSGGTVVKNPSSNIRDKG